jgi:2-amino-4-hydroxy-6-hydroxymethyldihydropteridine diphosphokinase/dihydropteroate synthase
LEVRRLCVLIGKREFMKKYYNSKFKQSEMVYLALGSNLGNRFANFRNALRELSSFFDLKLMTHIIETDALLLENSPSNWNIPYFNMMIAGTTVCSSIELLEKLKKVEKKLGRDLNSPRWSPRIIDIDIISYYDQEIRSDHLTIPHKEIKNRDFIQYLLEEIAYEIPSEIDLTNYSIVNHYVLNPQLVGIVNLTPDSFSDGGQFFDPEKAEKQARKLIRDSASMIDFGAQSTRPGYVEISAQEEISRLSKVLERCSDLDCISIDTYFDDVVKYVIKNHNIKWINDQNSKLNSESIKLIAEKNLKLVIMLHGNDISWFDDRIKKLEHCGMKRENIIIDPGIGFGKIKHQNIEMIRNINELRQFGCEILLGHSRKSFISFFSNFEAKDRDIETIAVSSVVADIGVDYLRVHNVQDHMRFFVGKHCIETA